MDDWGRVVAHEQIIQGWRTEDKEILRLANNLGWTAAHKQANRGWRTKNKEILKWKDKYGKTVKTTQLEYLIKKKKKK